MRKIIKDRDGNETVFEGTPEELAEHERRLKNETAKAKKKGILKGAPMEGSDTCPCEACVRTREWFRTVPQIVPLTYPSTPYDPITPWIGTPPHGGMCACPRCVPQWTVTTTDDTVKGSSTYEYNPTTSELKLKS